MRTGPHGFFQAPYKNLTKVQNPVDDYGPLWDYTTLYILGVTYESTGNPDLNHLKVVNELFAARNKLFG